MIPHWRRRPRGAREAREPLPFEMVSVATARAVIAEVIEPLIRDMETVRAGVWSRPLSDEHPRAARHPGVEGQYRQPRVRDQLQLGTPPCRGPVAVAQDAQAITS